MVLVFTDTTSLLSAEFVSTFSPEKLAVALFRISQDIGVEFSQAQKSFSIVGDWSKVIKAHSSLVEYFEKEQRSKQKEQIRHKENSLLSQNQNSGNERRRGRKPGCTVAKTPDKAVPEPYVQYHNDQGLTVNVPKHKRENNNSKQDEDETAAKKRKSPDMCDITVSGEDKALGGEASKSEHSRTSVNDGEYATVKDEFDNDAMDEDTDIDEQFLNNLDSKQSASVCLDRTDSNVKVKVEEVISDDEKIESLKRKRKSLAKEKKFTDMCDKTVSGEDKALGGDIDEQFLNNLDSKQSASICLDRTDSNVKVKVEEVISDDKKIESLKRKRKSLAMEKKFTDMCDKTVSGEDKALGGEASKSEHSRTSVKDGENATLKEEFDNDAMDEDTDNDEQFFNNLYSKQSASIRSDRSDFNVKVKVEEVISEDEKIESLNLKSKRKSKAKEKKSPDMCDKTVSGDDKALGGEASKSEHRRTSVNDGEYATVKEEFDNDAMDEDTDIDEQFLNNLDSKQSASICLDRTDYNVKVKVEEVISDDEKIESLKCRRKSKAKEKPTTKGEKTLNVNSKKGKVKAKLLGTQVDDSNEKSNEKKNVTKEEEEDKEFKCDKCEYVGKKRENLREHTQRMHRNKFKCETCSKQFGLHKDLLRHTRHVHTNPAYHCKICDKFYKFSRAYKEHMLSHDDNYVKPLFECEICQKVFSTKYVLTSHVKSEHLGMKKSFMCPACGRSFTQKSSYLTHANVHAGIKPYVCDVCGKAFSYEKSLKEHKYTHDDERRFCCDVCAKTFRQKKSLLTHMKVHKDKKDYICTSCGKGFTQKQALLRHERIHSGDKPFKCALCLRSFNDYSIIRRHMMMHHKRDKDPKTWRGDIICSLSSDN